MSNIKEKITKTGIQRLEVGEKLWDTEVTGLYVYRQKTKTCFYFKYRVDDVQKLTNIGSYGSISIEDAREKSREFYKLAKSGIDPVEHLKQKAKEEKRKLRKENYTIGDAYDDWETHYKPRLKKSSLSEWTLYDRYVKPEFEDTPLKDITPSDISSFHISIDAPYSANRCIKILKKLFNVARSLEKYNGNDPLVSIKLNPEKKRKRHLDNDEPQRLYAVLEEYKTRGDEEFKACSCILLYLLTGARKNEWLQSPKSQVDFERQTLTIPDTKNGEEDIKILSSAAIKLLQELFERFPDSEWIFPSPRADGAPLADIKGHWKKIKALAGIKNLRLHDFRRSFASVALSSGFSIEQIGELLNHKDLSTTKGYSYLLDQNKRVASETISQKIMDMLTQKDEDNRP